MDWLKSEVSTLDTCLGDNLTLSLNEDRFSDTSKAVDLVQDHHLLFTVGRVRFRVGKLGARSGVQRAFSAALVEAECQRCFANLPQPKQCKRRELPQELSEPSSSFMANHTLQLFAIVEEMRGKCAPQHDLHPVGPVLPKSMFGTPIITPTINPSRNK